jgi:hypothetical protein
VVANAGGTGVTVGVQAVAQSALTQTQQESLGTGDVVYDVAFTSGNQTVSNVRGDISVTVPYDGPLPVAVYYLNDAGELEKLDSSYDPVSKTVTFTTTHNSLYVLTQDDAWVNPFTDVAAGAWYYDDVQYVVENGIFNGTGATTFSPNNPMTRGMVVTVLYRLQGAVPAIAYGNPFGDVAEGQFYTDAVLWAAANGIVNGVGDGSTFAPNASISRQDLAAILLRYAEFREEGPVGAWAIYLDYADLEQVADYAGSAVMWVTLKGLMTGKPAPTGSNLFDPAGATTRAEVAAVLHRLADLAL